MKDYNHLIIHGGGILGFCYVGGVKYLLEKNLLKNVKKYTGTSIGSLICAVLMLDLDINELISFLRKNEFINKKDINLYNFINKFGLDNGERFRTMLHRISDKFTLPLDELYEITGKELNIKTVNLSQMKLAVMNYKTFPKVRLIDAIYMSCCIPLLFTPHTYQNDMYVDGCILSNSVLYEDNCILLKCTHTFSNNKSVKTLFDYIIRIIECILTNIQKDDMVDNVKVININNTKFPIVSYEYLNNIDEMIEHGYSETLDNMKDSLLSTKKLKQD